MAVDLSRVGLEGLETSERLMSSMAARGALAEETRKQKIANDQAEEDNAIQNRVMELMKNPSKRDSASVVSEPGEDDSNGASMLEQIGELMIKGGAIKKGQEYLEAGVDIRNKESEIDNRRQTEQKTRLDNIISVADLFSRTAGNAKNESEWRYGLAQFKRHGEAVKIFGEENLAALEQMEFNPEVVDYFNSQALSHKDKATLELNTNRELRIARQERDNAAFRRATLEIAQARHEESARHNRVVEKNAGKGGTKAPDGNQIKTAEAAIANIVFKGIVPDSESGSYAAFKTGAQDIASRAMDMVASNKGMNFSTAINRATIESLSAGDWESVKAEDKETNIGTKYKIGGSSMDPAPMPKSQRQLRTGSYYMTSRGIARWDGKNFVKDSNDE